MAPSNLLCEIFKDWNRDDDVERLSRRNSKDRRCDHQADADEKTPEEKNGPDDKHGRGR